MFYFMVPVCTVFTRTRNICNSEKTKPREPAKQNSDIWQDYFVSVAHNIATYFTVILRVLSHHQEKASVLEPPALDSALSGSDVTDLLLTRRQSCSSGTPVQHAQALHTDSWLSPSPLLCFCLKTPFPQEHIKSDSLRVIRYPVPRLIFLRELTSNWQHPTEWPAYFLLSLIRDPIPEALGVWCCSPRLQWAQQQNTKKDS